MIQKKIVPYSFNGLQMKGFFAFDLKKEGKRPAVLIVHTARGQDNFARKKAEELAQLGYAAFAVDLYGEAKETADNLIGYGWMTPLFVDRALLQSHIKAAYDCVRALPQVDSEKIGVMGYCFGGLTAIELLRSGANLRGAVSFHGVIGNQLRDLKAKTVPIAKNIKGSLLILHGHDDPYVSKEDLDRFQNELTEAKVDWQLHVYGHTTHAFTNPLAHEKEHGIVYNPSADRRSWKAMTQFFDEVFHT